MKSQSATNYDALYSLESTTNSLVEREEEFQDHPMMTIEKDKQASFLSQSLLSNIIFLCAGSMYMTVSIWDISPPDGDSSTRIYNWIGSLAPVTYLVNSLIDISLANRIRAHRKKTKMTSDTTNSISASGDYHDSFEKIRKHAAHRRELSAAVTFFIAAFFGTLCVIAEVFGADERTLIFLDRVSIHSYFISALFALLGSAVLKGQLDFHFDLNSSATLENLGDLFFLIGSVVDVILCDFHFDDDIVWWPIFSSFLWCLDASLYLKSDISNVASHKTEKLLNMSGVV